MAVPASFISKSGQGAIDLPGPAARASGLARDLQSGGRPVDQRSDADLQTQLVAKGLPRRRGFYRNGFKRLLDILVILSAVPVVLPIVLALAVMVAFEGGKPFYSQLRVGKGGRSFRMWKLRSMVHDADQRMEAYLAGNPEAREEWDSTQKLRNDPRITRFGAFLRRSSLDELPQLWNVLRGDMSLVGPRPMMLSQREIYPGRAYYALRPGLTGYWQTAGRNRTTFEARSAYDEVYEEHLSFGTDVAILGRTVGVVLKGTGC